MKKLSVLFMVIALALIMQSCSKEKSSNDTDQNLTTSVKVLIPTISISATTIPIGGTSTLLAEATGSNLIYRWFDANYNCIGNKSTLIIENSNICCGGGCGGNCGYDTSMIHCIVMDSCSCSGNSMCDSIMNCHPCCGNSGMCGMTGGCASNDCGNNGCNGGCGGGGCGDGGNCGGSGDCGTCISHNNFSSIINNASDNYAFKSVQILFEN